MLFIRFVSECSRMSLARRGEGGWSRGSVLLVRPPKFCLLWRALLPIFFTTNLPSSLPFFLPSHFPQTHFRLRGILVSTPATFVFTMSKIFAKYLVKAIPKNVFSMLIFSDENEGSSSWRVQNAQSRSARLYYWLPFPQLSKWRTPLFNCFFLNSVVFCFPQKVKRLDYINFFSKNFSSQNVYSNEKKRKLHGQNYSLWHRRTVRVPVVSFSFALFFLNISEVVKKCLEYWKKLYC